MVIDWFIFAFREYLDVVFDTIDNIVVFGPGDVPVAVANYLDHCTLNSPVNISLA